MKRILSALACVVAVPVIGCVVRSAGDGLASDRRRLAVQSFVLFLASAGVYSAMGLLVGNAPRLAHVGGAFLPAALFLLIVGAVARLLLPRVGPDPLVCAGCGERAAGFWRFRRFRPLVSVEGILLGLRSCSKCGCVLDPEWKKAQAPPSVGAGTLARVIGPGAAALLAAALLGVACAGMFWDWMGSRALGGLETEAGYERWSFKLPPNTPKPKDEDNAVFYLQKAGEMKSVAAMSESKYSPKLGKLNGKSESTWLTEFLQDAGRSSIAREDLDQVRAIIRGQQEALDILKKGLSLDRVHWGMDWSHRPAWEIRIPKYANLIVLARLLACEAVVASEEGRTKDAVGLVSQGLRFADMAARHETLIGEMVGIAMRKISIKAARRVLLRAPLPMARKEWESGLGHAASLDGFRTVSQIELFAMPGSLAEMGFWEFARKAARLEKDSSELGEPVFLLYWPFLKLDMASHHRHAFGLLRAMALDFPESKRKMEEEDEKVPSRCWLLAQIAAPRYSSMYVKALESVAWAKLALTALEAARFKQEKKRWPEAVWELDSWDKPDARLRDPFSGGWFRLVQRGKGVAVYSVGPDGTDDQAAPMDKDGVKGDLVWRLD